METITPKNYRSEVRSLAARIREEAREDERDEEDVLHETVDGHAWVIYTHFAYQVLSISDNDGAIADMGGPDWKAGWSSVVSQAAYCALAQDVREAFADVDVDVDADE